MAFAYTASPTSYKTLAGDIRRLIDGYEAGLAGGENGITEEEFDAVIAVWDRNCPNLLYEDEAHTVVSGSLFRAIGKRRAVLMAAAFRRRRP